MHNMSKMNEVHPLPKLEIDGADLPNKGMMSGVTDTYDSDLSTGYNKIGKMGKDSWSDMAEDNMPPCSKW